MTRDEFESTLHELLQSRPFQPFVIEMNDGRRWQLKEPHMVVNGGGAGFITDNDELIDFWSQDVRQITVCGRKEAAA